jgi:nucleoside-diphosphate-sugar epimerase
MSKFKILITGGNGNIAKIIRRNLSDKYEITALGRSELNILDENDIMEYLQNNNFDILVHTAISGGRRTKEETGEITHTNLIMWENLLIFQSYFKMIINFDSAAIYNRSTDIFKRKEEELSTIPKDYYGFSKYMIYQRSLPFSNIYNFRIFNIFHILEEKDRFIKACFLAKKNNTQITINEDKYFDFFSEYDFIKVIEYYFESTNNQTDLSKTINICYQDKTKLSDIAYLIINNREQIIVHNSGTNNYCGDNRKLENLDIDLMGLRNSLKIYEETVNLP